MIIRSHLVTSTAAPQPLSKRLLAPFTRLTPFTPGGQLIAFVPSLVLVVTRQTGGSGPWNFEEYPRWDCKPHRHARGHRYRSAIRKELICVVSRP